MYADCLIFNPHGWLERHALERPDDVAIVVYPGGRCVCWRALYDMAQALVMELRDAHISRGSCVALDLPDSPRFLAALAACDVLGLVPAPLHRRWSPDTRQGALTLLGAQAVILEGGIDRLSGARQMPELEDGLRPAIILFTSGSTGKPRAVPLSHGNLVAVLDQFEHALKLTRDHVLGAIAPWYHVAGLHTMTLPLWRLGAKIVCFERFDVDCMAQGMREHDITATFMVPTMWQALRQSEHFQAGTFDGVEVGLTGGARASLELLQAWSARGVDLKIGYGMTEAAPMVTIAAPHHWRHDPLDVGVPDPGVEVRLEASSPHNPSMILVRGPNVARAYLGEFGLERDRWTADGFFMTRDLGAWSERGTLLYLGRVDDVIVCGGEKISALEVEAALERIEGLEQVVVLGMPSDYWGEVVTAVWPDEVARYDVRELRGALAGQLDRYKMPRACARVEGWPLGPTGKIDRAALRRELLTDWDTSKER